MSTEETEAAEVTEPKKENIFDLFKTDEDAEAEGIVLDYGDAGWLKVGRTGGANKRYTTRIEKLQRKYKRKIDQGLMRDAEARNELHKIFADTIVFDGQFRDRDGVMHQLKRNRDKVIWFFEELPLLFDDVREQASNTDLFLESQRAEEAKNSETSSSTA